MNNRGNITNRNGSWGFSVAYTDSMGKIQQVRRQDRRWTKKDAQRELTATLAKIDAGHDMGTSKGTVADYLTEWAVRFSQNPDRKETSKGTVRVHVHAYLIPHLGRLKMAELKPARIDRLISDLLAGGSTGHGEVEGGKPLATKTVRNIIGTLHTALRDAVRLGIIPTNPADLVQKPSWRRPEPMVFDVEQHRQFLFTLFANNDPLFPIWLLMLSTGIRRGEMAGLRWSDVNLLDSSITIRQTRVVTDQAGVVVTTPKTKAGERRIDIDSTTRDILAGFLTEQERCADALNAPRFALVATDPDGQPISPRTLTRRFQKACERAGVPVLRLHDTRHTHATLLIHAGENIVTVSHRLGHSQVGTTLNIYAHSLPSADRALADRFGQQMSELLANTQHE